jgi:hypothetical protein
MDRARSIHKAVLCTSCFSRFRSQRNPGSAQTHWHSLLPQNAPPQTALSRTAHHSPSLRIKKAARGRREIALPSQPRSVIRLHDRGSIHRDGPARRASRRCRLRPSQPRGVTIAERQSLGRPATQMTQPAVCSAHPERDSSRVVRLAQCESRPEHGVEPPEPAGPAEEPEFRTGMRVCSAFRSSGRDSREA